MAKQNKPAIRFKGFTDAWEQRKLGELLKTITTGKSVNSDDGAVAVGDIGILKTSCVSYDRFNPYESKPVVKDELQSVKCAVEKDSVIVSRMNTPERVGACGYVSTDFPNLFLPDRLWKLKFQDNVDAYFVYMMLVSSVYKEKITSMASGTSGSMYNIPKETFLNLQLVVPVQTSEQRKIGQVLRQLNDLITLHQRKYDKLQVLKKAMLEKMFPKNGSSVPEIRFKGFTDAWEQRKLTEFVEFFSGLTYTPNDVQENGTLVLRSSNVSNGEVVDADNVYVNPQVVNSENVKVGDIVVVVRNGSRSLIGKHAQIKAFMPNTVIGAFMTGIRSECPEFTNALLNTSRFEEEIAMNMGATINQITGYMFSKMEFKVPCLDEQKKIGEYFEKLDNLITLHQRELEKLQNIKKSMLEKMFV